MSKPQHRSVSLWIVGLTIAGLAILGGAACDHPSTTQEPGNADLELCRHFLELKNAQDPAANDLLSPAPAVTDEAIGPEEAGRIDADTFLRGDLHFVRVLPAGPGQGSRFLFLTKGSSVGKTLHVRSGDKVDRIQRMVTDAALLVEVRDGKIRGLMTQLPPE